MKLTKEEWQRLRELRKRFLENASENYWKDQRDLELYDLIYAARIGWKWDAVLKNLTDTGWHSEALQIIDWGCGTGIAARTVASWSGIQQIALVDQSLIAMAFAQKKLREEGCDVLSAFLPKKETSTLLLISHVVSELHEKELLELALFATTADEVIWVEPGSHELSRKLGSLRKLFLKAGHHLIAPCTHENACPMFQEKQERDWCHFFATPPTEIFQSSLWHEASRELGIDLRSLPYSYLAFSRKKKMENSTSAERLIGHPRSLKAHGKLFCCGASGLCERVLQKRDHPALFRSLIKNQEEGAFTWSLDDSGRIVNAKKVE